MSKWIKILSGIIVSFTIVFVVAGLIFYNILNSSLPQYSGTVYSENIKEKIEVYRDSMAIPYIMARNEEDAAFGLGYVHAQERLFSMDLIRRAGAGRLSEILGSSVLPFDKMFRTVGINRIVNKLIKEIDPKTLSILQAYSNGVNQYIKDAKGKYPVEFDVLGYEPYEWTPEHSLIVGRMMAWELNISWWIDISFTHLIQKLGEEKVKEILPEYPENGPLIIPPELKDYPEIKMDFVKTDRAFRNFMGMGGTHIGSNNWVVTGSMAENGKPILANDTHLAYSAPGRWFAAVIRGGEWNTEGFTLPGAPAIIIGKNKYISWVITNAMLDDCDFYIEQIDSTGKNYFYNNEWRKFITYKEVIKVKDSLDVVFEIKSTLHGPVISDIHPYNLLYNEKEIKPAVISMQWTGNEISEEMTSYYKINMAENWEEFKSALNTFSVPAQNFVYGDINGNIGYILGGKIPVRSEVSTTLIYDGTTDKYNWKGIVPNNQQPWLYNPGSNFIASANNKTIKNFKYHISNIWEPPSRYERIAALLSYKESHSTEDYKKYQMDIVSPYAQKITSFILDAFQIVKITDENLKTVLDLFSEWNYEMNEFSQLPMIYALFLDNLLKEIYYDEMGNDLFNEFVFVANIPYRSVMEVLSDSSNSWFDNVTTKEIETKNFIIRKSLVNAITELEEKFGTNIEEWQWGKMHKAVFKHTFTGNFNLLDKFIDIGPYNIGGDGTTIFNTEYPFRESIEEFPQFSHEKFENVLGPTMKYIFDFAKPDQFFMVLTTGQSGNVMSDHYRDMNELWLRGNYVLVRTDENSIRNNRDLLIINPE